MATIGSYTAAVTIDGSNDYLLIQTSGVYKKINRATLLAISGSPVGTSDSQNLTNKTLDNTNTITLKDTLFTLQDDGDTTKQARFQLSGITTATTRTYTLPNASVTLASLTGTEALTNKTITSPAITGGTIDNTTITVDSISGHSSATVVTVANLQISNGVLNSANAVTSTSIAAGAVQPQALVTGTGSGWAFQSYTPTFTNVTVGNGTLTAGYIQIGKAVFVRMQLVFGTTSSVSGACIFTLPVTSVATYKTDSTLGGAFFNGASSNPCTVLWNSTTTAQIYAINAAGTYAVVTATSATIPSALSNGSDISTQFMYEAA